jgi:nicotinamide mononucleotide transporter PnuC
MKDKIKGVIKYFTPFEWSLWLIGMAIIIVGFFVGGGQEALSLISALLGITCVIFNAKGNVLGQFFAIGFAAVYATLAYFNRYYGEMIIYLALMAPIHIASIVSWIKHTNKNSSHLEVKINTVTKKEYIIAGICAIFLCVAFYFLLKLLGTDNLILSTISLMTSLAAAYLMLRRCEYFAICFILNDVVLIILWSLKLPTVGLEILPSILSFVLFLVFDSYSFISWKAIKRRQSTQQ